MRVGVDVDRQQRLFRDSIPQAIIDDAIVTASRKSLPFTAVPLMLDHTARALNAVKGTKLNAINIPDVRRVSDEAANILLRLKAVTTQKNIRGGSRMICRKGRTYISNRLTTLAEQSSKLKVKFLRRCPYLSVSVDETDAWSVTAPLSVALQGCDTDFNWGNFFIGQTDVALTKEGVGIYNATRKIIEDADAQAGEDNDDDDDDLPGLEEPDEVTVLVDELRSCSRLWERIVWCTTDGASAMRSTSRYAGLDAKPDGTSFVSHLKRSGKEQIGNLHCLCHNLNLALKEAMAENKWCDLWLQHIRAVYNWFSKSPARKSKFAALSEEMTLLGRVVSWKMVYPKYYCPTRWVGIATALASIVGAADLHREYCRYLIASGYLPDRDTIDVLPEEAGDARVDEEVQEGADRHHEATFYRFDDDEAQPWDLCIMPIEDDAKILSATERVDLDVSEMTTTFKSLDSGSHKKSKLLNEQIGMTDLNLGLDAMMLDALQPYKRLVERLQVQTGPIAHRLCGWIIEFYDTINTVFLDDTPTYGHRFNEWLALHNTPEEEKLVEQIKVMGRSFLHSLLERTRYRIQPYWKFIMGLELINPCAPHKISKAAWEGLHDLMVRAGFDPAQRIEAVNGLKMQRRSAARWTMSEIKECNKNLLLFYKDLQRASPLQNSMLFELAQLIFSLHAASAIIETFFSKTAYIKSKTRKSMKDSTVAKVLHVSQTPEPKDVEKLPADPISIDVTSASLRTENDLDSLREKYLGRKLKKSFKVEDDVGHEGELISYIGTIDQIYWEMELHKFLFLVIYEDGDKEELELWQVRAFVT